MQVAVELKTQGVDLDAPQIGRGDNRSPTRQAVDYVAAARRSLYGNEPVRPTWVIVSDMNEFRLYWYDRAPAERISFSIRQDDPLNEPGLLERNEDARFDRFLFAKLFHANTLLSTGGPSVLETLITKSFVRQREFEKEFFGEYCAYRETLTDTLIEVNPAFPGTKGRLLRLAQLLMDRAIFVFYCEDMGRAIGFPPRLLRDFLSAKTKDDYLDPCGTTIWEQIKTLFAAMNDGRAFGGHAINQFNGGLFAANEELNSLIVPNKLFCTAWQGKDEKSLFAHPTTLLYLSASYNFAADLAQGLRELPFDDAERGEAEKAADARKADPDRALGLYTLGRVFEQSITELEIKEAELDGRQSLNELSKRKRDGVYYTPEWIVDRILKETLGRTFTDAKTACGWPASDTGQDPDEAALKAYEKRLVELRILDPACGSGAFLITALKDMMAEWSAVRTVRQRVTGRKPTSDENALIRDLLTRNIFGVDINPTSVGITQLALWLHTARGGQPLSSLDGNIKCGNSLIGSDFWKRPTEFALNDAVTRDRINTFDWAEAFPQVFANHGGFDVIVSNPPYVKLQNFRTVHPNMADYLRNGRGDFGGYQSAKTGSFDLYLPFVEKGLELLAPGGRLGYIAPNGWTMNEHGAGLRHLVEEQRSLEGWIDFQPHQIFEEATIYTALQFFRKPQADALPAVKVAYAPDGEIAPDTWGGAGGLIEYDNLAFADRWLLRAGAERDLIDRLCTDFRSLDDPHWTQAIYVGLQTGANSIYHMRKVAPERYISRELGTAAFPVEVTIEDAIMHPLVSGPQVKRYLEPQTDTYVLFPYAPNAAGEMELVASDRMAAEFPCAWSYLQSVSCKLRNREDGKFDTDRWYEFGRTQHLDLQAVRKLIVARTVPGMRVCMESWGDKQLNYVRVIGILAAQPDDLGYLLGVLNGRVADFVFRRIAKPLDGAFLEVNKQIIAPLPIPDADPEERRTIAFLARTLQQKHTERASVVREIAHRCDNSVYTMRPLSFIFPADGKPAKDAAPKGRTPTTWVNETYETAVETRIENLDNAFAPDVTLAARFDGKELLMVADEKRVLDGIFLNATEGPFIAAQWNAMLADFKPGTKRGTAAKLVEKLRTLIEGAEPELIDQLGRLQGRLDELDTQLAGLETKMENRLAALYQLTAEERLLVQAG